MPFLKSLSNGNRGQLLFLFICQICWIITLLQKNLFNSMNFLLSANVLSIIDDTTFLKVILSMNQRTLVFLAQIDADRGVEYNRASSPNPSPTLILFFCWLLTSTTNYPSFMIKNELAPSFCRMRYYFSSTLHSLNLSISWSCMFLF